MEEKKLFSRVEFSHNGKKIYKIILSLFLISVICILGTIFYISFYRNIPNIFMLHAGKEEKIEFGIPVSATIYREAVFANSSDMKQVDSIDHGEPSISVSNSQNFVLKANETDNYLMELKLLGIVPLKTVEVKVVDTKKVYPMGVPIGIYVRTNGVLVVGLGGVTIADGSTKEPSANILKVGDYILEMNGMEVKGKKDLIQKIRDCEGKEIILSVLRDGEEIPVKIKPVLSNEGEYKIGIWIRDSAQGIGTMTYVDEGQRFGALGHGINDIDTNTLMDLNYGGIYETCIVDITRGENGDPGELTGVIDFKNENLVGTILENTSKGIFGETLDDDLYGLLNVDPDLTEVALKQEVHTGRASILCEIDGEVRSYDVQITGLNYDTKNSNRGLELEVTDPELIRLTGGIVQGMSGAPIIQDGKLIGAVTHVLVKDAKKGYGIFIENML